MSVVLPAEPTRAPLGRRLSIGLAVPVARLLARRPPQELRGLLTRLTARARAASYAEAKLVRDQVLTHSPRCRGGRSCLIRSITVMLVCLVHGFRPQWCVGVVAAPPFTAHAWVEAEGRMVDEPVDSSYYRKFFSVPASTRDTGTAGTGG